MTPYEQLIAAAEALDCMPAEEPPPYVSPSGGNGNGHALGERPGDLFNARSTWAEVLEPHGWTLVLRRGEQGYWRRPGKEGRTWSATTGPRPHGGDLLHVFTSSAAPFDPDKNYTKFTAYVLLNHGGDYRQAARALLDLGYQSPPRPEKAAAPPAPLRRVPASQLRRLRDTEKWLWRGLVPAEMVTIFSALPKAGKTTLLAHLLRAVEDGGGFCGQDAAPARVVYVTEESESLWAERRDRLGLKDHCEFILRPFRAKPTVTQWLEFLKLLTDSLAERPAELVVVDTLAKLWPVRNENDASEVTEALMPLLEVAYGLRTTLLLVHHLRKSEGLESTATRGSGGITASVDSIIELRRFNAKDRKDRRRVLSCDARFDDRVDEMVVELALDGCSYRAHGDRHDTVRGEIVEVLKGCLPAEPPGWTREEVEIAWPADECPSSRSLLSALNHGAELGLWQRSGEGKKGNPYRFWSVL